MTDPGESEVTIWPLATITDPCFNMQMSLFVQPWCNHKCNLSEWSKSTAPGAHVLITQPRRVDLKGWLWFFKKKTQRSHVKYCCFILVFLGCLFNKEYKIIFHFHFHCHTCTHIAVYNHDARNITSPCTSVTSAPNFWIIFGFAWMPQNVELTRSESKSVFLWSLKLLSSKNWFQ